MAMRRQGIVATLCRRSHEKPGSDTLMSFRRVVLFLLCLLPALAASRLDAQTISVRGMRGLSFGTVVPGVPSHILRTDPVNSGQFEIQGPFLTFIRLTFTLPTVLNGPSGATMPLSFATNDAGYSFNNTIGSQTAFDPNQPHQTLIWFGGRSGVFLGGTVSPTAGQRAGNYTATVVLTVVVL